MIEQILDINYITKIKPNFIYNRLDLYDNNYIILHITNKDKNYYLEIGIKDHYAELGAWLIHISKNEFYEISTYLFKNYKEIKFILFYNVICENIFSKKKFFYIEFPSTYAELEMKLTAKSRYNLRRNKRIAVEENGEMSFDEYSYTIPDNIVNCFFKQKLDTLDITYGISCENYIKKYHVTNAYVLSFGNRIASILFTCEQCPAVYFENFSYNKLFSSLSPGMIIYDLVIQRLIEKGKTHFFLGGGNYEYKKKYKSTEISVCEGRIYRNSLMKFKYTCLDFYNHHIFWKLKKMKTFLHI